MSMLSRIAGVTFKNEECDGGAKRQEILAGLLKTSPNGVITVDLKRTQFNGELAIKCVEHRTKKVMGYIPKKDLKKVDGIKQLTGFIDKDKKGKCSVRLDPTTAPSPAQYRMVKAIVAEKGLVMPAYDLRAYTEVFKLARQAGLNPDAAAATA